MGAETALAVRAAGALEFTDDERKMIRDSYANGATDSEFKVLMAVAQARRLNPLLRQVFFVKRRDRRKNCDVWTTQISIDGLRAVAERTGLYAGQDEPVYVEDAKGGILACKVSVYRKDWPRPAVGVAYFAEYVQKDFNGTPSHFWAAMPHVMIAKCAESLAIRKAFPEDTAGLYTPEEMGQADNEHAARPTIVGTAPVATPDEPPVLAELAAYREELLRIGAGMGCDPLDAATVWLDHRDTLTRAFAGDVDLLHDAQGEAMAIVGGAMTAARWKEALDQVVFERRHVDFDTYVEDLGDCIVASEVVDVWCLHKAALATLPSEVSVLAWKLAHRAVGGFEPAIKQPWVWLKHEVEKRGPTPPTGGGVRRGPGVGRAGADPEREAIAAEPAAGSVARDPREEGALLAAIQVMKECNGPVHVARHVHVHEGELPRAVRARYRDFAAIFLTGRYPKAVPTRDAALALLAQVQDVAA